MALLWNEMLARSVIDMRGQAALDTLPDSPGVYAVFRCGGASGGTIAAAARP